MMNNEKAGFTFQINTGEGTIILKMIKVEQLHTRQRQYSTIIFKNVDGLSIDLLKRIWLFIHCPKM